MEKNQTITIIGGGAVGCAVAYELSQYYGREVILIERNPTISIKDKNSHIVCGVNQSSRNAGVIHAGIYYPKNSEPLKAKLCVKGNELLYGFCGKNDVPCKKTGKLVVATNDIEEEYLNYLRDIARRNEVSGVRKMLISY